VAAHKVAAALVVVVAIALAEPTRVVRCATRFIIVHCVAAWAHANIHRRIGKPEKDAIGETEEQCVFCQAFNAGDDIKKLIVYRGEHNFIIMNLYPYNTGHLMIVPNRHLGNMEEMNDDESLEMMVISRRLLPIFKRIMKPEGFNLGLNLGRVAGAGIIEHVHMHIVPRWNGDSNFMPVLGETKVISEHINETFTKLRDAVQEEFS